ncbi:MAG: hypothetical protein AABY64_12045 [Bdellovibrionota bacterium]
MNLAQALSMYLNLNLLVVIGYVGTKLFSFTLQKLKLIMSAQDELKLHYAILAVILMMTLIQPLMPRREFFSPPTKVWAAQSAKNFESSKLNESISLHTYMGKFQ